MTWGNLALSGRANYHWRPNPGQLDAIKEFVIGFRDDDIPVLIFLKVPNEGRFDPHTAYLRTTNDRFIGQSDHIQVFSSSLGYWGREQKKFLWVHYSTKNWSRANGMVTRNIFMPEMRLSSGTIIEGHRVSKIFATTQLPAHGKPIEEQDRQLWAWAEPHVNTALSYPNFAQEMFEGQRQSFEAVERIPKQLTRAHYEDLCNAHAVRPKTDKELDILKEKYLLGPRIFPDGSVIDVIASYLDFARWNKKFEDHLASLT